MFAETGESPGVKHQDSQCGELKIFKLATAPGEITPWRLPEGCEVVNDGLIVDATNAANGSTPHL